MAIEQIDSGLCNGCGICAKVCPMDVLRMDKISNKAVITYPDECMLCEFCILDCPTKAITVTPEKHSPLILSWG